MITTFINKRVSKRKTEGEMETEPHYNLLNLLNLLKDDLTLQEHFSIDTTA